MNRERRWHYGTECCLAGFADTESNGRGRMREKIPEPRREEGTFAKFRMMSRRCELTEGHSGCPVSFTRQYGMVQRHNTRTLHGLGIIHELVHRLLDGIQCPGYLTPLVFTVNAVGGRICLLQGQISMYTANDDIFRERIVTLFTTGYFVVDLVDCATRMDGPYTFHAVTSLFLCLANYFTPLCQELRMTSKAALLEASTPFLYLAKKTRKPEHFGLFALVFTICRILWVPYMMKQILDGGIGVTDPIFIVLAGFYGLNLFWWYKILRIIVRGSSDASSKNDDSNGITNTRQDPPNKEK
eukprot:scaffold34621_cov166-Amphora_coffeaeformis.AAC.18